LRVYSSDEKLIAEFGEMRRTPIRFADIPPNFISALLSAEDDNFANHYGVDPSSLMRAATQLGQKRTHPIRRQHHHHAGGEELLPHQRTQLLAQSHRDPPGPADRTQLTKDEILELYVNKIYLGNRAYGIEAAAQVYYGKSIRDVSLAQMAMIAGLPKARRASTRWPTRRAAKNAATGSSGACTSWARSTRPATRPPWPSR
jgi:penicillin-binding protein 1A